MSNKNIYQRINAVMIEVKYIQKDGSISGSGPSYKAVTHDMVTAKLRESIVKNGIVVRLEQLKSEMIQERDVEKNIKMHLYSGQYNVHFVNIDKPDDFATVSITAHAADNGDKAPGKAASYATKYAMLKLFSLETGENDESRTAEPILFTQAQKDEFDDILARSSPLDMAAFSQTVGPAVMADLNSSFKDGEKSSGKAKTKKLISEGWLQVDEIARQATELLDSQDPAVTEIVSELTPMEKRMVATKMSKSDVLKLKKMSETV